MKRKATVMYIVFNQVSILNQLTTLLKKKENNKNLCFYCCLSE